MQHITNQQDVDRGAAELANAHPIFLPLLEDIGPLPLRLSDGGFCGLFRIVVGQQISTLAAASIWQRVVAAGYHDPAAWKQDPVTGMGLSRSKVAFAKGAANFDFGQLHGLSDDDAMDRLTRLKWVGPWTAQVYLLTCMGRWDVFPAADIALQEATRHVLSLPTRPTTSEMTQIADQWSPYRSIAARALWAYYRMIKGREGIQ